MNGRAQFWRQPQRSLLRRALFQIHLWSGIGVGIYVLLISISGSAVVFRNDIYTAFDSPLIIVEARGERMNMTALGEAARRAYPGYDVANIFEYGTDPRRAVEIRLERGQSARQRLFDPYTGADLGPAIPWPILVVAWFEDLHVNLFAGDTGRDLNAAGGGLVVLLALTGLAIWWQGIQNWKRGLWIRVRSGWKRFNWDMHSAAGFWTLLFTLMWGLTGIFAAIPNPFRDAVDYLEPLRPIARPAAGPSTAPAERGSAPRGRRPAFEPRVGDSILRGAYSLHFGNFGGTPVKVLWVVIGLAPGLLFLTGAIMWFTRVVRKRGAGAL